MLRMWDAQPRQRPTFAEVQGELIMQMLPDAAMLVQASYAATTGGLPRSWQQFTREQVKPIRAIGSHRVLLELPGGVAAVAERFGLADLQAELLVWKTLQHENVVPFLGTCDETGLLLVAFQSQGSIRDLLSQRTLPITQRLPMLLQAAVGLEFLHTRGVLHPRLSASNCLLTADLGVKLSGFSAAGLRLGGGGEPWCCPLARTTNEFSPASDVYSLAATVFEVLAFPALPPLDAGELRAGRDDWPGTVQELVAQCAQRTPDARPTVGQCVVALELAHFGQDRWEFAPAQLVLLQELGSGQFGVVNKMAANGITRPGKTTLVAVKQLKREATPESEAEFLAEMQLMMKLRHPNLVGLLGVVTKSDPLMLILEFLPGGSLDNWLHTPRDASTEDLLYILYQVALGMSGLHALGIVHRDLAARNVLVGVDLAVKVADYGLSRDVTESKEYYRFRSNRPLPLRWTAPEVAIVFVLLLI
jgi:serine/threonine protein kinase